MTRDELIIRAEETRETQSAMAAAAYVSLFGIALWLGAIIALLRWAL